MHLSMLSRSGGVGRPAIGGGFELVSFSLFKCPTPVTLSLFKRVQIPQATHFPTSSAEKNIKKIESKTFNICDFYIK